MREGIEAEVVSPHGFSDEALPETEIVQELIGVNIVVPGEELLVEPAAFVHHDDRIGRQNNADCWMSFDEANDSLQPSRLMFSFAFLFRSTTDGVNQDPRQQDQNADQPCMGDVVVLPEE